MSLWNKVTNPACHNRRSISLEKMGFIFAKWSERSLGLWTQQEAGAGDIRLSWVERRRKPTFCFPCVALQAKRWSRCTSTSACTAFGKAVSTPSCWTTMTSCDLTDSTSGLSAGYSESEPTVARWQGVWIPGGPCPLGWPVGLWLCSRAGAAAAQ